MIEVKAECALCGSHEIYSAYSQVACQFHLLNEGGGFENLDIDINTYYCANCETFGDHVLKDVPIKKEASE